MVGGSWQQMVERFFSAEQTPGLCRTEFESGWVRTALHSTQTFLKSCFPWGETTETAAFIFLHLIGLSRVSLTIYLMSGDRSLLTYALYVYVDDGNVKKQNHYHCTIMPLLWCHCYDRPLEYGKSKCFVTHTDTVETLVFVSSLFFVFFTPHLDCFNV